MFKKLIIAAIIILTYYVNVNSQCNQEWVARYTAGIDLASSIAVDGAGNVYVTGRSNAGGNDYATIKYNSSGDSLWVQRYNGQGTSDDRASSIAVDAAGNVYVTGRSALSSLNYDYATIKYDSSGVQLWVQRYNGPGNGGDEANSITVDGAGNVYVTGNSYGGSGTGSDYATIKYNSSGIQLWVQRYNGPGNGSDYAYSISIDGAGNVYVTGESYGSGTVYDYATIKYNSSGVQQWVQRYNGPGNLADGAKSIAIDGAGNIYVTGGSPGSGTSFDYATIKYDSTGVQKWVQRYNGPASNDDRANSISIDDVGNVYVTGYSYGSIGSDYATIKYNSSGTQEWVQRYSGVGYDVAYSIAIDGAGNVYVTGESYVSGTGYDYVTIKYNSSGVQQWIQTYNGPSSDDDKAYSIAVDGTGNVYVTGSSENNNIEDYATIKYSQTLTGINEENEIPGSFKLYQNYPNPFNPSTTIKYDIPKKSVEQTFLFVSLKIYNILGHEVATLINEQLKPGQYEINFDASGLSSGTYFYRLQAENYIDIKKMVVIK